MYDGSMKLKAYLNDKVERPYLFARRAGLAPWTVYRILRGVTLPNGETVRKIVRATKEAVQPNDLM